jgi:hypothetical protein
MPLRLAAVREGGFGDIPFSSFSFTVIVEFNLCYFSTGAEILK